MPRVVVVVVYNLCMCVSVQTFMVSVQAYSHGHQSLPFTSSVGLSLLSFPPGMPGYLAHELLRILLLSGSHFFGWKSTEISGTGYTTQGSELWSAGLHGKHSTYRATSPGQGFTVLGPRY